MKGHRAPHAHALADPRARELMRQYISGEIAAPWYTVADQISDLGLDDRTTRALRTWIRSLRRTV